MFSEFQKQAHKTVRLQVEGVSLEVPANASAATAALMAGLHSTRLSAATGEARAPYCMMGVCFDCLLNIDGEESQQACMVQVRAGMSIRRQVGARQL